jgi:hypothetical protein
MEKEESCFVKGMKATMYNHYPDEALAEFRRLIWKNLLENSRDIVEAIRKLKLDHANRSTKVRQFLRSFIFTLSIAIDMYVSYLTPGQL